jgi:hypothetical protein
VIEAVDIYKGYSTWSGYGMAISDYPGKQLVFRSVDSTPANRPVHIGDWYMLEATESIGSTQPVN